MFHVVKYIVQATIVLPTYVGLIPQSAKSKGYCKGFPYVCRVDSTKDLLDLVEQLHSLRV